MDLGGAEIAEVDVPLGIGGRTLGERESFGEDSPKGKTEDPNRPHGTILDATAKPALDFIGSPSTA